MHHYLGFEESLESPTDREPHRTSYLDWQPDRIRVQSFSCEPCPPSSKDYLSGSCRHLTLNQHSVPTHSLPGRYQRPIIQPGFLVTGPSFQSLNKITKTFLVSECSLHVGQVGSQNYDTTVQLLITIVVINHT
ncbi:hypothetical protein ILYODFUR_034728 [Ilyodon furcidens]|uniref:Uncharacterized protein n=1 Tax=Ilyodon furcidens TaxID=33524 RepID=A0ABV0UCM0_9TELE